MMALYTSFANLAISLSFCSPSEIQCPSPETPSHGSLRLNDLDIGSEVFYTCERGYRLDGPDVLVCGDNGEWSASPPVCIGKTSTEVKTKVFQISTMTQNKTT